MLYRYPDQQFFHTERIQAMMLDNLFIFSRQNESISYRQGMHELLALVIWVVDSGKVSLAPIDTTGPKYDKPFSHLLSILFAAPRPISSSSPCCTPTTSATTPTSFSSTLCRQP